MKKIYFFLFALLNFTLVFGQTVSMVSDSHEGEAETAPGSMIANSNFFIYAGNGANSWTADKSIAGTIYTYIYTDREVWLSDGTAANTKLVEINSTYVDTTDISGNPYTENGSASFIYPVLFQDKVYFSANNGVDSYVYYINSLSGDTVRALDNSWSSRLLPDEENGMLYFTQGSSTPWMSWDGVNLSTPDTLANQYESDGTTLKVTNATGGAILFGSKIIFSGAYVSADLKLGTELFVYDTAGTDGPVLLKDIRTGTSSSSPTYFVQCGDYVYFRANEGDNALGLWKTDGTEAGTVRVTPGGSTWTVDINSQPVVFDDKIYFEGDDDDVTNEAQDQLYVYDPTANSLNRISNFVDAYQIALETPVTEYLNFDPKSFVVLDNTLYFIAYYSYVEDETSTADKTTPAIYKLNGSSVEIIEESIGYYPSELLVFGSKIYFAGEDTEYINNGDGTFTSSGEELFVFDPSGTTAIRPAANTKKFSVSPNPSYGYVNIAGLEGYEAKYEIYNLAGAIIESGIVTDGKVDYSIGAGVYILRIVDGKTSSSLKIVVK